MTLLDKSLRFEILDGRVFIGTLLAIDKDRNIVVGDSVEFSKSKEENINAKESVLARKTGMIMLSGKDIVNIWKQE